MLSGVWNTRDLSLQQRKNVVTKPNAEFLFVIGISTDRSPSGFALLFHQRYSGSRHFRGFRVARV